MQTRFREAIRRKTNNRFFSDCAVFSTQHLNSPLLLESLTVFFKMCCGNNCLWSVIKMCLIIYEILDKYVDTATAVEYHKGKLFHKPKDSVYRALLAFTIIGCFISFFRICLYFWGIYLDCCSKESHDKRYDDFDMAMQSIKVILEAFPQSVIAKFYFVHCPIKKYGWGVWFLDPAFDGFCGAPFIFFLVSLCFCYCRKHGPYIECCEESEESNGEWSKNFCISYNVLFITFALSVTGLVFAGLSLSEFSKRCS